MTLEFNERLGRILRRRRRGLGLTQTALGRRCGLTFQQIQKYECGAASVSASRLWRLAQALEVSVAYFFGEERPTMGLVAHERPAALSEQR